MERVKCDSSFRNGQLCRGSTPSPPHSAAPHLIRSWRHADTLRTTSAVHNVQGLEFDDERYNFVSKRTNSHKLLHVPKWRLHSMISVSNSFANVFAQNRKIYFTNVTCR